MKRLSLVLVALLFAAAARGQISPGKLSEPHKQLEGAANCLKCHEPSKGVSAAKCLSCHTALRARIQAKRGLHAQAGYQTCERCHNEHHGRAFQLIHWGSGGMKSFNHKLTGFPLTGAHARVECRTCHKTRSFLGLSQNCTSCHTDPHRGQFGATGCLTCHTMSGWKPPANFSHAKTRFPLTGEHAKAACSQCHVNGRFRGVPFASCANCHKDPHAGRLGNQCTQCHQTTGWRVGAKTQFDHSRTGFPLTGAHAQVACARCHKNNQFTRIPHQSCASCHADPHAGRFGSRCEQCHTTARFKPAKLEHFNHDRTRFPLTGRHRNVACANCHRPGAKHTDAPQQCAACHRDPHAGRLGNTCERCHTTAGFKNVASFDHDKTRFPLRGAHAREKCETCHGPNRVLKFPKFAKCSDCHRDVHAGQFGARDCANCHTVETFRPSTFTLADHQKTKFPLAGAHLAVPCNACHVRAKNTMQFRFASTECSACHRDPHKGEVERFKCAACHRVESWARVAFDHRQTGFPLEGAHARVACRACHTASFRGLPKTCAGCHGGAFAESRRE
jgi:Cytochrome c7 and related cytochrome c